MLRRFLANIGERPPNHQPAHPTAAPLLTAQWRDPVVAPELADLCFADTESLGATFLADTVTLNEWTRGSHPLDDDHPGMILARHPPSENKQGSSVLGIAGDNSNKAVGQWFEGVAASGAATSATVNAVQANIVAAGYGK